MLTIDTWLPHREIDTVKAAHPVHRRKNEGDGYDFYAGEIKLAEALVRAQAKQAGKAVAAFDKITGLSGDMAVVTAKSSKIAIAKELEKLSPIMRESWDAPTEKLVGSLISEITQTGASRTKAFERFVALPTRASVEQGMVASAKYYTNEYFNRIVLPSMVGDIEKRLNDGLDFDPTFFRALREKMDTRLKSVPYWKLAGNQAASRAYHYGLMRAGQIDGMKGYTLVAVIDERTTDVCKSLNGKTFWLADGVQEAERVARIAPDRIAEEAPWLTLDDVDGKTSAQLTKSNILIPPFHASCRTTVALSR